MEHYGHRLRQELIARWKADPLPGSEQGLKSPEVSELDTLKIKLACSHVAAHPALHTCAFSGKFRSLTFTHCSYMIRQAAKCRALNDSEDCNFRVSGGH